jgi:DNA polymerase V
MSEHVISKDISHKVTPIRHGENLPVKKFSSSCLPNIANLQKLWPSPKNEGHVRLDPTCLESIGNFLLNELFLPHFSSRVQAGFPSPADHSIDSAIDLNEHLIRNPSNTYYVTATGDSMMGAGIFHKDILVVDRSIEARHGSIVIAAVDGELTVKRLHKEGHQVLLMPENPDYPTIEITKEMTFFIEGVVTSVIHQFKPLH